MGGAAACLLGMLAAPPSATAEVVSESIEVVEVEVPVQVLLDARPLRGLQKEDFELRVDGRRTPIEGFTVVDHAVAWSGGSIQRQGGEAIPLAARRHFLLLLDLTFASTPNALRARDAAIRLVRERIGDDDLVSVATLSATGGVTVLVGFTPDRLRAIEALEGLGRRQLARGLHDPLGLVFLGAVDESAVPSAGLGGESMEAARDGPEDVSSTSSYKGLTAGLTKLADELWPVAGHKHVLYLSEGVDSLVFLGRGGATQREREEIEASNEAAMRGEIWRVDSNARFGSTSALGDLERTLKELVRAGAEIDAIDVGGLRTGHDGRATGEDTLFLMARDTGGQLIRSRNDLEAAMAGVLDRTEVTYLLTFLAPIDRRGGRYERIRVTLRERRPHTTLVHRPGYFTPVPFARRSVAARRAEAVRLLLEDGDAADLRLEVMPGKAGRSTDGGRRSLPVALRVDLAGVEKDPDRKLELYVYAMTEDGRVAAHFAALLAPEPSGGVVEGRTELALPPGIYSLRCLARESVEGRFGRAVVSVSMPESDLRKR